jgi:FkbM family methyltransferase
MTKIKRNMSRKDIESLFPRGSDDGQWAKVLGSYELLVDPQDESIAKHLLKDGYWEAWVSSWMTRVIQPHWNCLDVGASYGYYTGLLNNLTSGKVVAIEANPTIVEKLNRSKVRNAWDRVEIIGAAAGRRNDTIELFVPDIYTGGGSFSVFREELGKTSSYIVDVKRIDDLVTGNFDFIKLDIEGYEEEAMAGATRVLSSSPLIAIEILSGEHSREFIDYLFNNYSVTNIGYDGTEEKVVREQVYSAGWSMLALRS